MKKFISILVASLFIIHFTEAQKLKGSDTVLPLAQKEAESFMKKHPGTKLTVTGGGSGVGLSALIENTTDIAMSSRKMKLGEKMKISEAGKSVKESIIAYDALAIIINPANKVTQLTREQIEGIYTGKIKNWKEVGGDDMAIVVYGRESSSGTYEFFKEHVMKNKNYSPNMLSMPATGAIVQSISQTKGAIGYVGLAYLEKTVKAISVSFDKGKNYIAPSLVTAKSKKYPITRPLYFYYLSTTEKMVKSFIDYILSAEGQAIVEKIGFVSL
ncbi:MAG: phosphate ABC transporter substrate-binding protein [Bacteroidetes bacterium]|nr:phosphate ABC transporter substrate-binding protein [Bacteroidota bacterium]